MLTRIVAKNISAQLIAELNVHLNSCFHQNCSSGAPKVQYTWWSCYSQNFGHSCQCQTLVSVVPTAEILGCGQRETCIVPRDTGESTFTVFSTFGRVTVLRSPKEAYHSDCYMTRVKHGGGSEMDWAAITWHSLGPILVLDGCITAKDYQNILEDHVHPMVQTLYPEGGAMYQDDNAPIHTARCVTEWFDEHESEAEHLPWPA